MTTPTINFSPVNREQRKKADIRTGDRVRVMQKIVEKGKTRLQPFEGLVIARKHGTEPGATFTVRRTTGDYGVEKVFPLYSPVIEKIEILRRSKMRQSNIYHIRRKVARQIRREMRRMTLVHETAADESEAKQPEAEADESVDTQVPETQETQTNQPDESQEVKAEEKKDAEEDAPEKEEASAETEETKPEEAEGSKEK